MDKRCKDMPSFFPTKFGKTCNIGYVPYLNKCQLISQSVTVYTVHTEHPTLNKCLKKKIPFPLPAKCKPIITMDRQLLTLTQNNYDS